MPFFKKLSGNITSSLKKASGGLDTALRKSINTAGDIGGYINKAAPILTAINPELGVLAGSAGMGLQQGSSALRQARDINRQARSGDIAGAIQKAKDVSGQPPSISFA
tara:strand:+ start:585 stop:908 length:324 start_codon:yes stop_codon:yes gene_type:complete